MAEQAAHNRLVEGSNPSGPIPTLCSIPLFVTRQVVKIVLRFKWIFLADCLCKPAKRMSPFTPSTNLA